MRSGVGWLMMAALAGCMPAAPRGGSEALAGSLEVQVLGDTVWLALHATNVTDGELQLQFASAQRYDFEVLGPGGEVVWRWSEGRMFAQVVAEEPLAPGATRRERVSWVAAGRRGEYVAVGRLAAVNHPLELQAAIELGAQ